VFWSSLTGERCRALECEDEGKDTDSDDKEMNAGIWYIASIESFPLLFIIKQLYLSQTPPSPEDDYHSCNRNRSSLVEGRGARTHEESAMRLVGSADNAVRQGELEVGDQELLDVRAANLGVRDLSNTDDLNGARAGTVAGSHVRVARLNSGNAGQLAVLLVHVVSSRARVVADPDSKVLDLKGLLLVDLLLSCRHSIE
jgi:hypothetical protein